MKAAIVVVVTSSSTKELASFSLFSLHLGLVAQSNKTFSVSTTGTALGDLVDCETRGLFKAGGVSREPANNPSSVIKILSHLIMHNG